MKRAFIIILVTLAVLLVGNFLLNRFFFKLDEDKEPELISLKENPFNISSSKPFYFKVDNKLFFAPDGKFSYSLAPIWKGKIEEAYISPNSKYALIFDNNELTLIENSGKVIFNIDNCTDLIAVEAVRKTGRFSGSEIQWSKNSDFFIVSQDRIWDKNYSKKNKTSIYKYSIAENSFKPLIDLDEEMQGDFVLSQNENHIYYEFATSKGDLAFKKVDLPSKQVVSEHFQDDSLGLTNITPDSIFINYNKFKYQFQGNSFNLKSIITTARIEGEVGLYFKTKDTLVRLLVGTGGYAAFKGNSFNYFKSGYFLPGNRFFIANISSKNYSGQLVIDTKTFQIRKLEKKTEFYFNVNSSDCNDFVFRYEIEPNVKFATSVTQEIEGR